MLVKKAHPEVILMVGVAQSVRAPGCGPGGRGFDSLHSPHFFPFQRARSSAG